MAGADGNGRVDRRDAIMVWVGGMGFTVLLALTGAHWGSVALVALLTTLAFGYVIAVLRVTEAIDEWT